MKWNEIEIGIWCFGVTEMLIIIIVHSSEQQKTLSSLFFSAGIQDTTRIIWTTEI